MSKKYPGGIIRGTPVVPTTSSAPGIWTVCQAQNYTRQGIWPRSPGAPTIGTATIASGSTTASVPYTAPTDAGTGSVTYTATSSPGGLTGTGASPISVAGLSVGTAYTFTVAGTTPGGTGPSSAASNSITPTVVVGQQEYVTAGTYSWVAPTGVTAVSVVVVGGGARGSLGGCCQPTGGGGGGLGYKNNMTVVPGQSYSVQVGSGGASCGTASIFTLQASPEISIGAFGGSVSGFGAGNFANGTTIGGGGSGGNATSNNSGGGGAGGYSGNGGNGASGGAGAGGAGGGGGVASSGGTGRSGGGGGVGLLGQGTSGAAQTTVAAGGNAGSGGTNGSAAGANAGAGGAYGGGGGTVLFGFGGGSGNGAGGAVRIIWPGTTRSFPSTNTGNL